MKRLPRRVHVLDYVINVRQLGKRAFEEEWGEDADVEAFWEADELRITLRRNLSTKRKRYLLAHELVHALNDIMHWEQEA